MNRPETATHGWVYLSRHGDRVKIGITLEPERRKRQLETGHGARSDDFALFRVYAPGACERHLHARWAAHRLEGEWFEGEIYHEVHDYLLTRASR